MGLFSSSKSGGTQVSHPEEIPHSKSRWFSSKPKHAAPSPPQQPKESFSSTQQYHSASTSSSSSSFTPIHQSRSSRASSAVPPVPPLPSFASSASNHRSPPNFSQPSSSSTRPPSLFSDRHHAGSKGGPSLAFDDDRRSTVSRVRGKVRDDVTTATLASRLNELALSNADGLLGDDEYRILRATAFEQATSGNGKPSEKSFGQVPAMDRVEQRMVDRENTRTPTQRHQNGSRASSTHSTSSSRSKISTLGSFFRRKPSRNNLLDKASPPNPSRRDSSSTATSTWPSSSSFAPVRSSLSNGFLLQVPGDRSRTSSSESRFGSSGPADPSIRSGRTSRSALTDATFDGRPSSVYSTTSTRASSAAPPSAFHLRSMHSGSLAEAVPGAEATTAEIRVEIASVEAEGRRLVDAFDGLEEAAIREAEGGYPSGGGAADRWREPPPPSRYKQPLKPAIKNATVPAGRRTSVASSFHHVSHSPSSSSSPSFLLGGSPTNGHNTAPPLSSLSRNLARVSPSSSSTSNPSFTPSSSGGSLLSRSGSSSTARGHPSIDRHATADDPEAAALEATILDLRRRKKDTEDRYQRRLEFLRGKLRAAELKERAMR